MPITSDFELAASAPDDALAQAVRDPMSSPISQIAALSELRSRQQLRQEAAAAQGGQPGTVADKILAPIGYANGGLVSDHRRSGIVQHFKDGSKGKPVSIIPESYIKKIEAYEGLNDPTSKNPHSTASGLYQFIDSTRRHLDKTYGFNPNDRSPETEKRRMMAYTQETIDELERNNIPVTGGTMYGGHLMGQRGVRDFYKAYQANPEARIEDFFSPDVIRKNPDIFNPRGGKKRETLAEVMTKLDQVGGGRTKTPRSAEDMNLGAALQTAKRADSAEDASMNSALALASMLEQTKTAPKPAPTPKPDGMAEDPTLAKLYAAIGARSRQPAQADSGDDLQTIEDMNNQVRRRMAQFRQQQPMYGGGTGGDFGFRDGGIVQHFRDGSEGPVYPIYGSDSVIPDPFLADLNYLLESGGAFGESPTGIPLGSIPEQNPLSLMPNPFPRDMSPEPSLRAERNLASGPNRETTVPDLLDPNYGRSYLEQTYRNARDFGEQRSRKLDEILGFENQQKSGLGKLLVEAGRYRLAAPEALGMLLSGVGTAVSGGLGYALEDMTPGAWSDAAPSEPAKKAAKKPATSPATAPAKAPPTTKLAPTGAPVSGTSASPAGNAPTVRDTGIAAGMREQQTAPVGSPYGPAEQFVRELYKEDAARQERLARREEEAKRMARIQAGLAIASGDSQYFAKNLARAIPIMSDYQKTRAGLDEESDAFEQQFRERLIGARGIDVQQAELMKRVKVENAAKIQQAQIEAGAKVAEERAKGAITPQRALEMVYEYYTKPNPLTGELPAIPAEWENNREGYALFLAKKMAEQQSAIPITPRPQAAGVK
jgi:hypothetical protein